MISVNIYTKPVAKNKVIVSFNILWEIIKYLYNKCIMVLQGKYITSFSWIAMKIICSLQRLHLFLRKTEFSVVKISARKCFQFQGTRKSENKTDSIDNTSNMTLCMLIGRDWPANWPLVTSWHVWGGLPNATEQIIGDGLRSRSRNSERFKLCCGCQMKNLVSEGFRVTKLLNFPIMSWASIGVFILLMGHFEG